MSQPRVLLTEDKTNNIYLDRFLLWRKFYTPLEIFVPGINWHGGWRGFDRE